MKEDQDRCKYCKGSICKVGACIRLCTAGLVFAVLFLTGCRDRAVTFEQLETEWESSQAAETLLEDLPGNLPREVLDRDVFDNEASDKASMPEPDYIYVYVCGAVSEPGVVSLPAGSRYVDALEAAGGFLEDAASNAVNLAAVLTDGIRWYVPTKEEAAKDSWEQDPEQENSVQPDKEGKPVVNLNTATVEQLCMLPGIGESKAAAIVEYRSRNGAFVRCEDVMKVSGIKESAYEKIRDYIKVK